MTNVNKNERFIPIKNYFIAALIVVVVVALTMYAFAWYKVLQENKVANSYLIKEKVISNEIKDLEEVEDVFSEAPKTYYVYVSYTGDKNIYNMEKDLKKLINSYNLNENFYYLNVTSIKDEDDYIDKVNEALNLKDIKITNVPTIIYYSEGQVKDIIKYETNQKMNVGDFQKILDQNRITK